MEFHQTANCLLLTIPRELRDHIWSYCVDYPDMSQILDNHLNRARSSIKTHFRSEISQASLELLLPWSSVVQPEPLAMQTSSLLLVNRQISAEALEVLHSKTFRLDAPIPANYNRNVRDVFVTDFVSEGTLQTMRRCYVDMSFSNMSEANSWYRTTNHLTDIWISRNSLKSLVINIDPNVAAPVGAPRQEANAALIRKNVMASLENLSKKVPITFTGAALPIVIAMSRRAAEFGG